MKLTKRQLRQLIKEEYSNLNELSPAPGPDVGIKPTGAEGAGEEPSLGFEHKLNRILEILEQAPWAPSEGEY